MVFQIPCPEEYAFMTAATRTTKSFSLDREILREVERTRGTSSTSERVNSLLRVGLEVERKRSLHGEAAAFFREGSASQDTHDAFIQAAVDAFTRDDD